MEVLEIFSDLGARTKYDISVLITDWFPELAAKLPPRRKIWMSEDERTAIFDAASFALALYMSKSENTDLASP